MLYSVFSFTLVLIWVTAVEGQGECYFHGGPDCDRALGIAACRLHDPGSLPPLFCDSLKTNCTPPLNTCSDILRCNPSISSGYYQIQAANGSLVQVYCDMEGANCGGEGGWTRVFRLNMTDPSSRCPTGFSLTTQSGIRFCTRTNTSAGCTGINTNNFGHNYTQVCGFARGYSFFSPDAFGAGRRSSSEPLSGNYVDGVSITYGTPPNHLWTYAAGVLENRGNNNTCPCNTNGVPSVIPSYVGSDYYCESAVSGSSASRWYTNDPLWDGMLCRETEGPCCVSTSLPWFNRNMLDPTDDDILIRVCLDFPSDNEAIGLERLEIYIK